MGGTLEKRRRRGRLGSLGAASRSFTPARVRRSCGGCKVRFLWFTRTRWLALFLTLILPTSLGAADPALRTYHPWGCFNEGSWAKVRVTTETFDEAGKVTNTSGMETKTTLSRLEVDGVALLVENVIDVAGKRLASQQQTVKLGFAGEQIGQNVAVKNLGVAKLQIAGRQIPCKMQELEVVADGRKRVTVVHYSDELIPHILRRRSVLSDLNAQESPTQETTVELVALDTPINVLGENRVGSKFKIVQKSDRGSTITESTNAAGIPGELVSHTSTSLDAEGRLLRRSRLQLVEFHVAPDDTAGFPDGVRMRHRRRDRR
jgi:hypothetical protein